MKIVTYEHGDGLGRLVEEVTPESYMAIGAMTKIRIAYREARIMVDPTREPGTFPVSFPVFPD